MRSRDGATMVQAMPCSHSGLGVVREGAGPAQDERAQAIWCLCAEREADPSAHRVAPEVGPVDADRIQDGEHVLLATVDGLRRGVVRLVARALAQRIEQDQLVVILKRGDISPRPPSPPHTR